MTILPKFLYLFSTFPTKIPSTFHHQDIRRLHVETLAPTYCSIHFICLNGGGLGVPDTRRYHLASHLVHLFNWSKHRANKLWVSLEQAQSPYPLAGLPWCLPLLPPSLKNHPTIGTSTKLCHNALIKHKLAPPNSAFGPPFFWTRCGRWQVCGAGKERAVPGLSLPGDRLMAHSL